MLCNTCLGVLQECQNTIKSSHCYLSTSNSVEVLKEREIVENDIVDSKERHAIYGHHVSFSGFQTAARNGCQICYQAWGVVSGEEQRIAGGTETLVAARLDESRQSRFRTHVGVNSVSQTVEIDIYFDGSEGPQHACAFYLCLESGSCKNGFIK